MQLLNHLTSTGTSETRLFFKDRKLHLDDTFKKSLSFIKFLIEKNSTSNNAFKLGNQTDLLLFFVDEWWKHLNLFFQMKDPFEYKTFCTYIFQEVLSEKELKSIFSFTPFLMTYLCYSDSYLSFVEQLNKLSISSLKDDLIIGFGEKTFFQLTQFDVDSIKTLNSLNGTLKPIDCIVESYFSLSENESSSPQIDCFSKDKKEIGFETIFLLFNLCRWQEDLSCDSLIWFTT